MQASLLANLISGAFLAEKKLSELGGVLYLLLVVTLGRVLVNYLGENFTNRISHRIRVELRRALFHKILVSGTELNLNFGPGRISLIATKAISNLEPYFTRFVPQIFIAASVPLIVGITITILDRVSGLIVLLTLPLIPIFGVLIGKYTSTATSRRWKTMGILSGYLLDLLNGLTTLKVYGRATVQRKNIESIGNRYREETMRVLRISFLTSLALELIATLSVALIAVSIGLRMVNGDFELWRGLTILILAPEVYWPIRNLSALFHASADGIESANDIFEILDFKSEVLLEGIRVSTPKRIEWDLLEIEFSQRSRITIPPGEILPGEVTIVSGPSGSGKSSLINILLRTLQPSSGMVRVDGLDLRSLDRRSWLNQIAWVPQEPRFPTTSIRELLKLSSPNASDEDLLSILREVGLRELDIDGPLALSIGQQRRVAIARALLRESSILILDEPSASMDEASESLIIQILRKLADQGKMVLAVSHRDHVIKGADKVIGFSRVES